jgi:hypothetical protein
MKVGSALPNRVVRRHRVKPTRRSLVVDAAGRDPRRPPGTHVEALEPNERTVEAAHRPVELAASREYFGRHAEGIWIDLDDSRFRRRATSGAAHLVNSSSWTPN